MTQEIITHGVIKHLASKPCRICKRQALESKQNEAKTMEPPIESEVPQTQVKTHQVGQAPKAEAITITERTFSEQQVAEMLEEVQKATTHRIFNKMYEMLDKKQADLAPPILRREELQALQESYETNSQSAGGQ